VRDLVVSGVAGDGFVVQRISEIVNNVEEGLNIVVEGRAGVVVFSIDDIISSDVINARIDHRVGEGEGEGVGEGEWV